MKITCCIKAVPDPASRLIINETKTWIKLQDVTFVASEADNYSLEEALRDPHFVARALFRHQFADEQGRVIPALPVPIDPSIRQA